MHLIFMVKYVIITVIKYLLKGGENYADVSQKTKWFFTSIALCSLYNEVSGCAQSGFAA